MYIDYYVSQRGIEIEDLRVAPVAVISWGRGVIQSFADTVGAESVPHWIYNERYLYFAGRAGGRPVSFVQAPVGAPGTVMLMEELIACGTRLFLGLGWAGSLLPAAPLGAFLIPTSSIREEGTSPHYLDPETEVAPDEQLVRSLLSAAEAEGTPILTGPIWTTDAPYRELFGKIESYGRQGVLGVDMETSAMYALGQFRGVRVCNLLVVSDELWQKWQPAFGTPRLREATAQARRILLRCLSGDLPLEDAE
jgi:uridine phosphorylase